MLFSDSQNVPYYSQCNAHYSHVLGFKGWHQINYEYKLTIARSVYDCHTKVVKIKSIQYISIYVNPHNIQMVCDIIGNRGWGANNDYQV